MSTCLNALEDVLELWADECGTGVGGIHVEPDVLLLTDQAQLMEVVKGAHSCGPQRGTHLHAQDRGLAGSNQHNMMTVEVKNTYTLGNLRGEEQRTYLHKTG